MIETRVASELMPSDDNEMAKLIQQTEELAKLATGDDGSDAGTLEILRVTAGKDVKLALPYENLDEVLSGQEITPIPGAPPEVLGVMNLDGRLLTVLDLARVLGIPTSTDAIKGIAVVSSEELQCGLAVTEITSGIAVRNADVRPAPRTKLDAALVTGVIDDDTALLNVAALIRSDTILVNETA